MVYPEIPPEIGKVKLEFTDNSVRGYKKRDVSLKECEVSLQESLTEYYQKGIWGKVNGFGRDGGRGGVPYFNCIDDQGLFFRSTS